MPNFRKNDQVIMIAGDDKGKSGRILKVLRGSDGRLIVEKINFVKRHTKPRGQRGRAESSRRRLPCIRPTRCTSAPRPDGRARHRETGVRRQA